MALGGGEQDIARSGLTILREIVRRVVIYVAAAVFAVALVLRFHELGGPYFTIPETIQDHVAREPYPSRDAIVMSRRAALILPRGSTVTVLVPSQAPNHDATLCYTAVGLMPHHNVVLASLDAKPRYVITVREPLDHPGYRLLTRYREGSIYELR